MAEPHTHGGTDAPECTTCKPIRMRTVTIWIRSGEDGRDLADGITEALTTMGLTPSSIKVE